MQAFHARDENELLGVFFLIAVAARTTKRNEEFQKA